MIVVIGSPLQDVSAPGSRAAGLSVGIARAAARAGAEVQLVGKVGEDRAGEAVLLDLARSRVGHAAILRDPSGPTRRSSAADPDELDPFGEPDPAAAAAPLDRDVGSLTLEPADLELALRYLPDYRVLVLAEPLSGAALEVIAAAIRWSAAALVAVVGPGKAPGSLPEGATVLEGPYDDPDGTFGEVVGALAAALDQGDPTGDAIAAVSSERGWSTVED